MSSPLTPAPASPTDAAAAVDTLPEPEEAARSLRSLAEQVEKCKNLPAFDLSARILEEFAELRREMREGHTGLRSTMEDGFRTVSNSISATYFSSASPRYAYRKLILPQELQHGG